MTEIDLGGDQPLFAPFDVLRRRERNDQVPEAFGLKVADFAVIPVFHAVQSPLPFLRSSERCTGTGLVRMVR